MKRFLPIALAAGLLSPIAPIAEAYDVRSRVDRFTDQKVCWGEIDLGRDILRHDGFIDIAFLGGAFYPNQYRYRVDNYPPSKLIKLDQGGGRYFQNKNVFYREHYPLEKMDNFYDGYLIDVRNLPEGEKIRYEFSSGIYDKDKKITKTFIIPKIKSLLLKLKDCPKPKSY